MRMICHCSIRSGNSLLQSRCKQKLLYEWSSKKWSKKRKFQITPSFIRVSMLKMDASYESDMFCERRWIDFSHYRWTWAIYGGKIQPHIIIITPYAYAIWTNVSVYNIRDWRSTNIVSNITGECSCNIVHAHKQFHNIFCEKGKV